MNNEFEDFEYSYESESESEYDENYILSKDIIDKLYVGQVFNSYKDMCNQLNIKYVSSNSKVSQMNELNRLIKFRQDGWKYIIEDIYPRLLPKKEHGNKYKINPRSIYVASIECVLMQYLSKHSDKDQEQDIVYFTNKELWRLLGMVNSKFSTTPIEDLLAIDENINKFDVYNFYRRSKQKLSSILTASLNSLQNRSLLTYSKSYKVVRKFLVNEEDKKYCYTTAGATDYEIIYIDSIKREVFNEMTAQYGNGFKFDSYKDVMNKNLGDVFNEYFKAFLTDGKHCKYLIDEYALDVECWDYVYPCVKMLFDHKQIVKELPSSEVKLQKLLVNTSIIKFLTKQAEDMYNENEKLSRNIYDLGDSIEEINAALKKKKYFAYSANYLENQRLLTEELIAIK